MRFKNTKYVIYNFLSYEYRHIEDYLEEMALKGWILSDIKGDFLKFKRSEPRSLKYSVDIFDSISLFAGKDNERALEYREYCKKAGWDFVCEREKIQIYFSEGSKEKVEIHTDEFEKFNIIMKASLKHVLLNFINIILLLFPEYLLIFKGTDGRFLANSLSLGVLLQLTIFATHEFTGITNFLLFSIKGRRNLYLEDFGDKNLGGNLFVDSRKSPIASNMYYNNEGEKLRLSYTLFASKYEWPVKYNFIYEVLLFKVGLFYWNK